MSKSLNRVDLSGYVAYPFIGTSSQGNEYARFKLKHITGMRDGKETFTLIDCVVFGEALQHCRPFLVENTHCVVRGNLQVTNKKNDYDEWVKDCSIKVVRMVEPSKVKELNEPAPEVATGQQGMFTTSEPVQHRVEVKPRRKPAGSSADVGEIVDDDIPF